MASVGACSSLHALFLWPFSVCGEPHFFILKSLPIDSKERAHHLHTQVGLIKSPFLLSCDSTKEQAGPGMNSQDVWQIHRQESYSLFAAGFVAPVQFRCSDGCCVWLFMWPSRPSLSDSLSIPLLGHWLPCLWSCYSILIILCASRPPALSLPARGAPASTLFSKSLKYKFNSTSLFQNLGSLTSGDWLDLFTIRL